MDAGHGPDSDDYFKANGRAENYDVKTRVQKLNFLSTSRSPSAQKDQQDSHDSQVGKAKKDKKSKQEPDEEAHVLGAWLQDEHVLELLKLHSGGKKKKDNTGNIYTTSQSEVTQTQAKGMGNCKTAGAESEAKQHAGLQTPAVANPTASAEYQTSSNTKKRRTLISL